MKILKKQYLKHQKTLLFLNQNCPVLIKVQRMPSPRMILLRVMMMTMFSSSTCRRMWRKPVHLHPIHPKQIPMKKRNKVKCSMHVNFTSSQKFQFEEFWNKKLLLKAKPGTKLMVYRNNNNDGRFLLIT